MHRLIYLYISQNNLTFGRFQALKKKDQSVAIEYEIECY